MNISEAKKGIEGRTILITGGTGSFGNAVVKRLLVDFAPKKIIIFSRDEKKQFDMGNKYESDKLKFIIGDVRERDALHYAMKGVDVVFSAAALKQVPNCEFFPMEALRTNAIGTYNAILAASDNGAQKFVLLSTDKAVYPISAMGMTKAIAERIMIAASRDGNKNGTTFCGTRYGNVMYTRGSVIPYFIDLMRQGKPLTVTNPHMTRFMLSLDDSIYLVLYAVVQGQNGNMYVKKAPASTVGDIAQALVDIFNYDGGIEEIGVRPGEKMHETLLSREELPRTEDHGDYYCIRPEVPNVDYRDYYFKGFQKADLPEEGYTSENTERLSLKETKELLLSLKEVQEAVKELKGK